MVIHNRTNEAREESGGLRQQSVIKKVWVAVGEMCGVVDWVFLFPCCHGRVDAVQPCKYSRKSGNDKNESTQTERDKHCLLEL
jgi:hypothetical protein